MEDEVILDLLDPIGLILCLFVMMQALTLSGNMKNAEFVTHIQEQLIQVSFVHQLIVFCGKITLSVKYS